MFGVKQKKIAAFAFARIAKFSQKYTLAGIKDPKEKNTLKLNTTLIGCRNRMLLRIGFRSLFAYNEKIEKTLVSCQIISDIIEKKLLKLESFNSVKR